MKQQHADNVLWKNKSLLKIKNTCDCSVPSSLPFLWHCCLTSHHSTRFIVCIWDSYTRGLVSIALREAHKVLNRARMGPGSIQNLVHPTELGFPERGSPQPPLPSPPWPWPAANRAIFQVCLLPRILSNNDRTYTSCSRETYPKY